MSQYNSDSSPQTDSIMGEVYNQLRVHHVGRGINNSVIQQRAYVKPNIYRLPIILYESEHVTLSKFYAMLKKNLFNRKKFQSQA